MQVSLDVCQPTAGFDRGLTVRKFSLKAIVETLEMHRQRATYGAVAGLVGKTPRSVMQGLPRNWRNSWVVSQENGEPSEYHELQKHVSLRTRDRIIDTPEELATWLDNPD